MERDEFHRRLAIWLGLFALLLVPWPSAADPLGATLHGDGRTCATRGP